MTNIEVRTALPVFKQPLAEAIRQAVEEERERVRKALMKKFNELEHLDPNTSTEQWRNYKGIRNNINDTLDDLKDTKSSEKTEEIK